MGERPYNTYDQKPDNRWSHERVNHSVSFLSTGFQLTTLHTPPCFSKFQANSICLRLVRQRILSRDSSQIYCNNIKYVHQPVCVCVCYQTSDWSLIFYFFRLGGGPQEKNTLLLFTHTHEHTCPQQHHILIHEPWTTPSTPHRHSSVFFGNDWFWTRNLEGHKGVCACALFRVLMCVCVYRLVALVIAYK